jgi:hypothetical protein
MKIVFTDSEGIEHVFENITECYLAVRQTIPVMNNKKKVAYLPETKSYSWGPNLRELAKEISQSIIEIQNILKDGAKNANT